MGTPPRRLVLLVEDDELMTRLVIRALSPAHEVVVVSSVAAALVLLESGARPRFDVILCSLVPPHWTGLELFDALAGQLRGQEKRLAFITSGAFTQEAWDFLQRVPNLRLEKPFALNQLRALVNEAASGEAT